MAARPSRTSLVLAVAAAGMALLVGLVGATGGRRGGPVVLPPRAPEPVRRAGEGDAVLIAPPPAPADEYASAEQRQAETLTPGDRPPATRIAGAVLRPDGTPASGARIAVGSERGHADAEGRFELALPPAQERLELVAFEPGHEPAVLALGAPSGAEPLRVRVVLGPETLELTGTVVTHDGRPLEGWTAELDGPDLLRDLGLREPSRTDADGRFVIADVPGGVHMVRVLAPDRTDVRQSRPAVAGELGLTIVVEP